MINCACVCFYQINCLKQYLKYFIPINQKLNIFLFNETPQRFLVSWEKIVRFVFDFKIKTLTFDNFLD